MAVFKARIAAPPASSPHPARTHARRITTVTRSMPAPPGAEEGGEGGRGVIGVYVEKVKEGVLRLFPV